MKTSAELQLQLDKMIFAQRKLKDESVQKAENEFSKNSARIEKVRGILPALQTALAQEGLGIVNLNPFGQLDAEPLKDSKKFRFIQFAGYLASGAGKNQDRLNAKADRLAAAIKAAVGFAWVEVNPFSLEINKEDQRKLILISFGFEE